MPEIQGVAAWVRRVAAWARRVVAFVGRSQAGLVRLAKSKGCCMVRGYSMVRGCSACASQKVRATIEAVRRMPGTSSAISPGEH